MSDFKDSWKQTGIGLGHAFRDLGKSLVKTGKKGVDSAVEWANGTPKEEQIPEKSAADTAEIAEASVANEIQQLAQLKEQGLLTEEEFEAKKKQLLGI